MAKEHSYSPNWQTSEEPEVGLERADRERAGESAAGARAHALAADVAAARVTLQAEQRRSKNLEGALSERNSTLAVVRSTVEELLRESERYKSELRTLRESLAARDARLSALQQEHAKVVRALEAAARSTAHPDTKLQAARAEAGALALELKTSRETVAALTAQIHRGESEVKAARAGMNAANSRAGSYLELLRTHEWRRGFDHNMFRELDAKVGTASAGHHALESERDRLQRQLAAADSERARWTAQLAARDRALVQAQERAASDVQGLTELKETADLRQAEQATQIERLQAEADQREQERGVLMTHLQEARRPIEAFEADHKRLSEELAAKDAELAAKNVAAAECQEENRRLRATLERTRGSLEVRDICRPLERSESNSANALGGIQTSTDRLVSVPGGTAPGAGADAGATASGTRSAELIRIDGEATTTYVLAKRTRIGRAADCEMQIHSSSVSRHHALVIVGPRDTVIEDLNSTNGVLVNGRLVTRRVLVHNDELAIGEARFRYSQL